MSSAATTINQPSAPQQTQPQQPAVNNANAAPAANTAPAAPAAPTVTCWGRVIEWHNWAVKGISDNLHTPTLSGMSVASDDSTLTAVAKIFASAVTLYIVPTLACGVYDLGKYLWSLICGNATTQQNQQNQQTQQAQQNTQNAPSNQTANTTTTTTTTTSTESSSNSASSTQQNSTTETPTSSGVSQEELDALDDGDGDGDARDSSLNLNRPSNAEYFRMQNPDFTSYPSMPHPTVTYMHPSHAGSSFPSYPTMPSLLMPGQPEVRDVRMSADELYKFMQRSAASAAPATSPRLADTTPTPVPPNPTGADTTDQAAQL